MLFRKCVLSLYLILLAAVGNAKSVAVVDRGDENARYAIAMIELAISKTNGGYTLEHIAGDWTFDRQLAELNEGKLDVLWAASSRELENKMTPVRVPLYKGLLGQRVLLVHKNASNRFQSVRTLADLQAFKFCQGLGWADTGILASNGLQTVVAPKYPSLFHMTDGGRCDAFPRGMMEPWDELKNFADLDLMVDEHILLSYQMPYYLFVRSGNHALAKMLENGLRMAIADGSFDTLFLSNQSVKTGLSNSHIEIRTIIKLDNPTLSLATPVDDSSLWFGLL